MVKEKKDLFVQLLPFPSTFTDKQFDEYRKSFREKLGKDGQVELGKDGQVEFSLNEDGFGITLNTIIISNESFTPPNDYFKSVTLKKDDEKKDIDCLDKELFVKSQFYRKIYYSNKPIMQLPKIQFSGKSGFYIYINISNSIEPELNNLFIHTFTLTTFNPEKEPSKDNYVKLSNKDVITLSNWCAKTFDKEKVSKESFWKNIFDDLAQTTEDDVDTKSVDDTFRSIQFWGNNKKYKELHDARNIIKNDIDHEDLTSMYYFYSILTHEFKLGLLRRHLKNIIEVMGYCQSISDAYFDVFYGNVCLEVTIMPKNERFKQIGHDSEEFRIWEILALQKYIAKKMQFKPESFNSLDNFFDFSIFTKKLEKGSSWIEYANYLQKDTGIQFYFNRLRKQFEREERERGSKLQKLNILIIVSIFISMVTFFLSPLYSKSIIGVNSTNDLYSNIIYTSYNPEFKVISLAILITAPFYLYISSPKTSKSKGILKEILRILKENLVFCLILFIWLGLIFIYSYKFFINIYKIWL